MRATPSRVQVDHQRRRHRRPRKQQPGNRELPPAACRAAPERQLRRPCQWPSIRATNGQAKIEAQGDETDLSDYKALDNLPDGKYLISVTSDGFKIGGAHFTVDGGSQKVTVDLDPSRFL